MNMLLFSNTRGILKDVPVNEPVFHVSGLERYVNSLLSRYEISLGRPEFDELVQQLKSIRKENLFQPTFDSGIGGLLFTCRELDDKCGVSKGHRSPIDRFSKMAAIIPQCYIRRRKERSSVSDC